MIQHTEYFIQENVAEFSCSQCNCKFSLGWIHLSTDEYLDPVWPTFCPNCGSK